MEKAKKEKKAEAPKGAFWEGGLFYPDPTPVAPPAGYRKQPSMIDEIRRQVHQVSKEMDDLGFETFEEANDFDVGDDYDPTSPHEIDDEAEVPPSVLRERAIEAHQEEIERLKAQGDQEGGSHPSDPPPEAPKEK